MKVAITPTHLPSADNIALVVLNIYATTSKHLHAYCSQGAEVGSLDPAHESALQIFENSRFGGSVVWINAEGVTFDELASLQKQWLPASGRCVMLLGAQQSSVAGHNLHSLVAARQANANFEAVVMTAPNTSAKAICRLMAAQSGGWLHHEEKDLKNPQETVAKIMSLLGLRDSAEARVMIESMASPAQKSAEIFAFPSAAIATDHKLDVKKSVVPDITDQNSFSPFLNYSNLKGLSPMATLNDSMNACMQIDGAMAAALVDMGSGMALAKIGSGVNLDVAAAGNTEVLKSKLKTMASLGLKDNIEDMLITLGTQYHLIRPIPHKQGLFLYLVLDKTKGNLAMARFKLMTVEKDITV